MVRAPESSGSARTLLLNLFFLLLHPGSLLISQCCPNHNGTFNPLFLHLAAYLISAGNIPAEVIGIGGTSAAAVKSGEAVLTFVLCIYVAKLKLITDSRIGDSFI